MREKSKEENGNYDYCELETKNVELENSVAKLLSENERLCKEINHVKQVFKEQFDSIKKTRVHTKEHSDSLIDKLNLKSAKNEDLKAQIRDKVFVITSLKNNLRKLKGKEIVDLAAQTLSAYTIVPGMFKLDLEPLAPRKVNKKNSVVKPIHDVDVKHSLLNVNSEPICATCKKSMFDGVHDMCLLDFVENVNSRAKSAKKHKNQNIWKPTGHVFTEVGFKWKPTGSTFTIVGNSCPLTRITSANVVPPKKTTSYSVETQKPELKVYSRKPKNVKNVGSSKKAKIVESKNANHLEPNHTWGSNATDISSSSSLFMTVRFGNDHITRIIGYVDYQLGNATILRVYYVEGLRHNLFFAGQFCDADLKVAFWKNTFFIHNLEGVDLLSRSRDTNLYTISLDDMLKTSMICLLLKASKIKSWLWHHRLSHLKFGTLNKLAKDVLARGIPRHKFQKDHMCSACALGKSKKSSYQHKAEDTNQEKIYLLHMDLCGPMRVASINGKSSGPGLHSMTPATSSSRLVPNPDAPSSSTLSTQQQEQSPNISYGFEESPHEESTSLGLSSNVRQTHTPFEHLGKWTKDHPIENVIGDPSRSVSMRKQLQTNAMWCYFNAFLTSVEPKNFKQAMTKPSWIDAMQEEIHEFQRLEV
ncbi:retrovirus-related pol polyprotein from transposon TNT 1-94 [Tanacetum coccineum]